MSSSGLSCVKFFFFQNEKFDAFKILFTFKVETLLKFFSFTTEISSIRTHDLQASFSMKCMPYKILFAFLFKTICNLL